MFPHQPDVSIIVPVYNVAEHVAEAIASLRSQTHAGFEAIVIDDGSTDGSGSIARDAAQNDPRFTFLEQANAGLGAARNVGLAHASAPVIGFLDSDDRYAPQFLETMLEVLNQTGCSLVACAIQLVWQTWEGPVSAMHGVSHPATRSPFKVMPLSDWRSIVQHWPSAWNKLYRRDLIEGLSFLEATHFEDHPWFHQVADRADRLAYIREPLYLHTRERPGQITADTSEQVFDIFDILDASARTIDASAKRNGRTGLANIATRAIQERADVLTAPDQSARFARRAGAWLSEQGLSWSPEWDRGLSHAYGETLAGQCALSVVIATDAVGGGLLQSLTSLAYQHLPDLEVVIVPTTAGAGIRAAADRDVTPGGLNIRILEEGATGVSDARNRGLEAAEGLFTVFLDAADIYTGGTLWNWVEGMLRSGAEIGLARFSPEWGAMHAGCHDGRDPFGAPVPMASPHDKPINLSVALPQPKAVPVERLLALHSHPSAKIFRTEFLRNAGIAFPPEPLASWTVTIGAAAMADRAMVFPGGGLTVSERARDRRLWRAARTPEALHAALMLLAPTLDPLMPRDYWLPTLMARALWEKANYAEFDDTTARDSFLEEARSFVAHMRPHGTPDAALDPYIGADIRILFNRPTTSRPEPLAMAGQAG